ncbi:MAG: hypothetical protein ACRECW_12010 [Phyllobacterium sp.]
MTSDKRLSRAIRIILVVAILLLIAAGAGWHKVTSMGHDALLTLAREGQFCKADDCADGVDYAKSYLAEEFGLSPRLVEWCIGVDALSVSHSQASGSVRSGVLDLLYLPCGEPIEE